MEWEGHKRDGRGKERRKDTENEKYVLADVHGAERKQVTYILLSGRSLSDYIVEYVLQPGLQEIKVENNENKIRAERLTPARK